MCRGQCDCGCRVGWDRSVVSWRQQDKRQSWDPVSLLNVRWDHVAE